MGAGMLTEQLLAFWLQLTPALLIVPPEGRVTVSV
jgi:hypothetical protein